MTDRQVGRRSVWGHDWDRNSCTHTRYPAGGTRGPRVKRLYSLDPDQVRGRDLGVSGGTRVTMTEGEYVTFEGDLPR